jgi:hypothetical protein
VRDPWARQEGETMTAYLAFRAWRDRGPLRDLRDARWVERRWSWQWRWRERAEAWDDAMHRAEDERRLARVSPS